MTAKPKPALHLVGPDLEALEADINATVTGMELPAVSRCATRRNEMEGDRRRLEAELEQYRNRQQLIDGLHSSASAAIALQVADIEQTLALYSAGLGAK